MSADARLNSRSREIGEGVCDEAQRMADQLNQDANALAADAAKTINDVLGSTKR